MKRRKFLIGSGLSIGAISALGYSSTLKHTLTFSDKGAKAKNTIYANAQECEVSLNKNEIKFNDKFSIMPSVCNGCVTFCSVRAKIDKKSQKVLRVSGNPYSLLSSDPYLDMNTPLKESFIALSNHNENGLKMRSTCCVRGNFIHHKLDDEFRITKPLKRVGKRGENKWKSISIEELISEIVNGGDLFNEGHVEGLKTFYDTKTLIDEKNPDYGPLANKLCILGTGDEGRQNFITHRFAQSFGTINYLGHTGICGLSMRAGEAAYLNDFQKYSHLKPDFEYCKFLLNIATAPAQAGNPFKRQAHLLAKARSEGEMKYVTITPNLTNADTFAVENKSKWIPIKPGSDLAFVMGMLRVIIENKLYNLSYLQIPSLKSQLALNDVSFTNATHLILQDEANYGTFLRGEDNQILVLENGILKSADEVKQADLEFNGIVEYKGQTYQVKTSFEILKENVFEYSLEEYAKKCEIEPSIIADLAKEFTSYGRAVATDCHGGTMHTTGFYTTYAIMMLGSMVGNLNYKGGMSIGGGKFNSFNGKMYNLLTYEGKNKPYGTRIDRARKAYETSTEFQEKIKNNQNPYPAKDQWYPLSNALENEVLTSSANAYPYKLGTLITWGTNLVYGQNLNSKTIELLKDPKKSIPLFIAIDPFINETSLYADYIVPDSVLFETWGVLSPWAGYTAKTTHLRFPIIQSPNEKFKNGQSICMDSFLIELGKALNLPSFGKDAIKDKDGNYYPLDKPEDFYLRAFLNVALDTQNPVNDISDEELKISGLQKYEKILKEICKEHWRKVAFIMSRGGRFSTKKSAYKDNALSNSYKKAIAIYNEKLAKTKNALSGERYSGTIKYYDARYANGEKITLRESFNLLAFNYKSNIFSSYSATLESLKEIKYSTYIDINSQTAKKYNIKNGDKIKLSTYETSIIGYARIKEGIHPCAIGLEHGDGRNAEGAKDLNIDGKVFKAKTRRKIGITYSQLGLRDITRPNSPNLSDFVIGSNARQAFMVKIEKI
ncbi:molybdopterin-dependent oxidoreductase [Campylobacter sp. LH-2024]|uniref:molybdopterin-dependent oxidoreductase n=1 Tax=Campylobacter sp. LH-2024 TaxID=3239825 RepID=UPI003AA9317B